jgi:hypothetical protein
MKRLCVLGSIAADARLVGVDAVIPPTNTVTLPTSAARRDIVGFWTGSFGCIFIFCLILHRRLSPERQQLSNSVNEGNGFGL